MVNFTVDPQTLNADLVFGVADIFDEIRDKNGDTPISNLEALYAANVFDEPLGLLTPIETPEEAAVTLGAWKTAEGVLDAVCNGNSSLVNIELQGMIANGTYSLWLNQLNKPKKVGESIDFANDVERIMPLGNGMGTENIMVASSTGQISASIEHTSCILTGSAGLVMIVIYHINGNTYGPNHIPDTEEVNHMLLYFQ
jgi:hypothetical protein